MRQLAKLRMRNLEHVSGGGVAGAIAGNTAADFGLRLRFYRHSAEHHQLTVLRLVGRVNLDRLCLSAYRHRSVVAVIAGCIGKTEILDIGVLKHKAFQTASGNRPAILLAPACGVIHRQSVAERTLHEQVIAAASKHSHFGIKIIHHIVVGLVEYEVGEEIHRTCHTGKDPLGFGAHTGAASCRVSAHSYRRVYLFGGCRVVAAACMVGVVKRIGAVECVVYLCAGGYFVKPLYAESEICVSEKLCFIRILTYVYIWALRVIDAVWQLKRTESEAVGAFAHHNTGHFVRCVLIGVAGVPTSGKPEQVEVHLHGRVGAQGVDKTGCFVAVAQHSDICHAEVMGKVVVVKLL